MKVLVLVVAFTLLVAYLAGLTNAQRPEGQRRDSISRSPKTRDRMMAEGKQIFRFDTFGDEVYWTDKLKLHQAIQGSKFGGVGPGVSPKTALAVGLKVDMDALPRPLIDQTQARQGEPGRSRQRRWLLSSSTRSWE